MEKVRKFSFNSNKLFIDQAERIRCAAWQHQSYVFWTFILEFLGKVGGEVEQSILRCRSHLGCYQRGVSKTRSFGVRPGRLD